MCKQQRSGNVIVLMDMGIHLPLKSNDLQMPATTRGSINRETTPDTTKAVGKSKMSDKKKKQTLEDLLREIKKENKKTEEIINWLEKKFRCLSTTPLCLHKEERFHCEWAEKRNRHN